MSRHFIAGTHSQSDEILAQIFLEHVKDAEEDIIHPNDGPWVLSRVCHAWRNIALSHPEIWSIIRVDEPDPDYICDSYLGDSDSEEDSNIDNENPSRKGLNLLNLALERSQDHPLEV
ncbi:hypothetical protein B0H19DRAFT_1249754 [Mycena capillaripes]|nr:hypothetical protein B0H19DRAFT_1249754 [Mycena capillaripes]